MRSTLFILLALVIGIFFLPKMASTTWVKRQVETRFEKELGGRVSIENLSFNWFNEQHCHHVTWEHPEKGLKIEAEDVIIPENFIDCLRYKEKPLHVTIIGITLDLKAGMSLFKKTQKNLHIAFSPIFAKIEKGQIDYQKIEMEINNKMKAYSSGKIDFAKENLDITLELPQPFLAKIFKECRKLPEDFLLEVPISCDLSINSLQKSLFWFLFKNYTKL